MSSVPLRLYRSDRQATLAQLFDEYFVPKLKEAKASVGHIRESRLHLERWQLWWQSLAAQAEPEHTVQLALCSLSPSAIAEPPAAELTAEELVAWRRWLEAQVEFFPRGVSNRTLNKHVQTITSVLAAAAELRPREFSTIKVKRRPEGKAPKYYFTTEQLSALYNAADAALWPNEGLGSLTPGDFWRCAMVLFYNYGFRTQELVAFDRARTPLLVRQLFWEPVTPHPAGTAVNSYGWLSYVPQKQSRSKPDPLVLPINRVVYAHIQKVITAREAKRDEPLLPVPRCNRSFYAAWGRILVAAKVRPKASLDGTENDFLPKHFRKTCTTYLNLHRKGIAPYIVGHAARESGSQVSDTFYDNTELAVLEALSTLPQPPAYEKLLHATRQRDLF
jgi:integrase